MSPIYIEITIQVGTAEENNILQYYCGAEVIRYDNDRTSFENVSPRNLSLIINYYIVLFYTI